MNSRRTRREACDLAVPVRGATAGASFCILFLAVLLALTGCSDNRSVQPLDEVVGPAAAQQECAAGNFGWAEPLKPVWANVAGVGQFTLEAKYTYIRSYSNGGGIFLIRLVSGQDFSDDVHLTLVAEPELRAQLTRHILNKQEAIAEITIRPSEAIAVGTHQIEVLARTLSSVDANRPTGSQALTLEVEVFPWGQSDPAWAIQKRDELLAWVEANHPELGTFSGMTWYAYHTYPQILVVEHWTFLSEEWEVRMCYHVMIPPGDWSKIWLRPRGEWNAILAAHRYSDGTVHEISVDEYPTFYGY